jgi:hypothetical protein
MKLKGTPFRKSMESRPVGLKRSKKLINPQSD